MSVLYSALTVALCAIPAILAACVVIAFYFERKKNFLYTAFADFSKAFAFAAEKSKNEKDEKGNE